jgi:hypothetical protein
MRCFNGPDNCSQCTINRYSFEEEIVTFKNTAEIIRQIQSNGGHIALPKSDVHLKTECVEKCPSEKNGFVVLTNLIERTCK